MIKVAILRGGLGNQMFSYAFYIKLKCNFRFSHIVLEPSHCFTVHQGYELPDVFTEVETKRTYKYYRRIHKLFSVYFTKIFFKVIKETCNWDFSGYLTSSYYPFLVYDGFWQSEKYFSSLKNEIINKFRFNDSLLNSNTRWLSEALSQENSVSIHIRRGDYLELEEFRNICTIDYYRKAVSLIESRVHNPVFYVFSNDLKWVKDNLTFADFNHVDWNNDRDSWQDMYLMTKCKHNIIANSSFSWWGAWLNENPDKMVIAPSRWFNSIDAKDIVPENWIKIEV